MCYVLPNYILVPSFTMRKLYLFMRINLYIVTFMKSLWLQQNSFKYIHERRKSRLLRKYILNKEFNRIPSIQISTIVKKMKRTTKNLQHTSSDLYIVTSIVRPACHSCYQTPYRSFDCQQLPPTYLQLEYNTAG